MLAPRVLRVVSFGLRSVDSPVDPVLRDMVLPRLLQRRDVSAAWIGRRGTPTDQGRVLASCWSADPGEQPADLDALGDPALAGHSEITTVEQRTLAIHARFERSEPARILRVFRGDVRPGEMDAYVDEARGGMLADSVVNDGLIAFVLGVDPPDSFVTVSAWTSWAAIEAATGGNTQMPFATRNARRLATFSVAHYELLVEAPDARGGSPIEAGVWGT